MSYLTGPLKRTNIDDDTEDVDLVFSDIADIPDKDVPPSEKKKYSQEVPAEKCCNCEMGDDTTKIICIIASIICGVGVLLLVILVPLSVMNVSHDEYAIRYDDLTNVVHEEVYTEGKYVLTPQTKWFIYSNLVNKIELDITCLTANGIEVEVDVDIQFQIEKQNVFKAFSAFGEQKNALVYFEYVCVDSILDSCGEYDAKDFYEDRMAIQITLEDALIRDAIITHTFFNITSAVLSSYDFPDSLENSIKEKRAAENDIEIAENEREGALVEANTLLLQAEIEAEKLAISAQAEVDSIMAEADAQSNSVQQQWENRKSVYETIIAELNMTADEFVFQYLTSVVLNGATNPVTSLSL